MRLFSGQWVYGLAGMVGVAAVTLGAPAATAQLWADVEAAANKEGTVVFYNNLQPNGIEPLLAKFRESYPQIQAEQIRLGSNPLIERFQTEFNAGRNLADVLLTLPDETRLDGRVDPARAEKFSERCQRRQQGLHRAIYSRGDYLE
jgi:ABC-type glycerol-3-phosphate transport system substrate-binding protein